VVFLKKWIEFLTSTVVWLFIFSIHAHRPIFDNTVASIALSVFVSDIFQRHNQEEFRPIKNSHNMYLSLQRNIGKYMGISLFLWIFVIILETIFCQGENQAGLLSLMMKVIGYGLIVSSIWMYNDVNKRNKYLAIGETALDMQIVRTGAYAYVRHPYYLSCILKMAGVSLVLQADVSLLIIVPYAFSIAFFINIEEAELENDVEEYKKYKLYTKYKLLPGVW